MAHEILEHVLRPLDPPRCFEHAAAWWTDHRDATRALERPIDRAIIGATRVDRLGFAFAGGYAAALRAMVPSVPDEVLASFAATEDGGAHPRAITTTLTPDDAGEWIDGGSARSRRDRTEARAAGAREVPERASRGWIDGGSARSRRDRTEARAAGAREVPERASRGWILEGRKTWVTLGPEGGVLLIVARIEPSSGDRPSLRIARIESNAPGVTITALPHMPFVPEIGHASLTLERVRVRDDQLLPGDGYDRYLKPFRTIEDIHVHAALLAWLSSVGVRARWPHALLERASALLLATRALSELDPSAPATHVALGGVIAMTRAFVADCEPHWADVDEPTRTRWQRDRALLGVASKAREARLERAWSTLTR